MKNIKEFYKKYKEPILLTGCIVGAAVVAVLITNAHVNKKVVNLEGLNVLTWKPIDTFMNLERAKESLDLNANNSERFAIFRDGSIPENYLCILVSDNVVLSK